jgi:hypothetical protein
VSRAKHAFIPSAADLVDSYATATTFVYDTDRRLSLIIGESDTLSISYDQGDRVAGVGGSYVSVYRSRL